MPENASSIPILPDDEYEHPVDWWEVWTSDDAVFRVTSETAELLLTLIHEDPALVCNAVDFTDLYGSEATIVTRNICSIFHHAPGPRMKALARAHVFKSEEKAFKANHPYDYADDD